MEHFFTKVSNLIDSYVTDQFSVRTKCFCNLHCTRGMHFWQWCSWICNWIQNCYCLYYMHAVLYFKISMFYKFKFTTTLSLILKIVTSLDFCLYVPNVFPGNYVQYQAVFSRPSYDHSVQQPKCSYPVNTCNGWRTWKNSRKISV